ncbi:hypothetical protein [Bradyrhizobium barranii]|nr:hypothetical protein [Bradyrhizobium barranii]
MTVIDTQMTSLAIFSTPALRVFQIALVSASESLSVCRMAMR